MSLPPEQLKQLTTLSIEAAEKAARYIRASCSPELEVDAKPGGSSRASQVVTEVDRASQGLIVDVLEEARRDFRLGLLAEESADDASRHTCDYFWCVDPLDGTLPFVEGRDGHAVSIALVRRDGVPVTGVVVDPVREVTYHAHVGGGAWRNGRPWMSHPRPLTLVMDRSFKVQPGAGILLEELGAIARREGLGGIRVIDYGGAAMNACWVIENAPAVYFKVPKPERGGGSVWDFAATACLFSELGAVATDVSGRPLDLNPAGDTFMNRSGVLFASHHSLAQEVQSLCQRLR
jgi:fructose-1,6-bisphosphatase/inositol monophosphatase family enzyme